MCIRRHRDQDESDTESTDDEAGWGGFGMFEYGKKGLPHALFHARELVETYGHHGAACTCVGEAGHKIDIKSASRLVRTYGDRNRSQEGMLEHVHRDLLWSAVFEINRLAQPATGSASEGDGEAHLPPAPARTPAHNMREPIRDFHEGWSRGLTAGARPPPRWESTFLSKRVLVTRAELVTLLRTKLQMPPTWPNITLLAQLQWEFFGCAVSGDGIGARRKVVGISSVSPQRRDFVRLRGDEHGTVLSAQVTMFVRVSGLAEAGIQVPLPLLHPANDSCNDDQVSLALVRWLSPHPLALLCDDKMLPVCPPPFGINHALWTFSKTNRRRGYLTGNLFAQQLHLFPGRDRDTQRINASSLSHAMYDLITIESIDTIMNCTPVDNDNDCILETVTLPF